MSNGFVQRMKRGRRIVGDELWWQRHHHGFQSKPWEREGDPGYDGDPESCLLCHFTEGNPIHNPPAEQEKT